MVDLFLRGWAGLAEATRRGTYFHYASFYQAECWFQLCLHAYALGSWYGIVDGMLAGRATARATLTRNSGRWVGEKGKVKRDRDVMDFWKR